MRGCQVCGSSTARPSSIFSSCAAQGSPMQHVARLCRQEQGLCLCQLLSACTRQCEHTHGQVGHQHLCRRTVPVRYRGLGA